jgi:hypothetical protein
MQITYINKPGNYSDREGHSIDFGALHTTEGWDAGDISTLTGPNVSIHELVPRQIGTVYTIVPWKYAAWHAGYGRWGGINGTGQWVNFNPMSVGWELGHRSGQEQFTTEHLARAFVTVRAGMRANAIPRLVRHKDFAYGRPESLGGSRSDPTDFPMFDSFAKLSVLEPYNFIGKPDIGLSIWTSKLKAIMSPQEAAIAYSTVVARDFRPGPLLAMLWAESSGGTSGVATTTKSWGNTRSVMKPERQVSTTSDGWPVYASWQSSLEDVMDRLLSKDKPYIGQGNNDLALVRMFWAPYGDSTNDPLASAYNQLGWIAEWAKADAPGVPVTPTDPSSPIGTYPVAGDFLPAWTASGGVWKPGQLTPGYALTQKFTYDGLTHQRFERGVARLNADNSVSWLLLRETAKLPQ